MASGLFYSAGSDGVDGPKHGALFQEARLDVKTAQTYGDMKKGVACIWIMAH